MFRHKGYLKLPRALKSLGSFVSRTFTKIVGRFEFRRKVNKRGRILSRPWPSQSLQHAPEKYNSLHGTDVVVSSNW